MKRTHFNILNEENYEISFHIELLNFKVSSYLTGHLEQLLADGFLYQNPLDDHNIICWNTPSV